MQRISAGKSKAESRRKARERVMSSERLHRGAIEVCIHDTREVLGAVTAIEYLEGVVSLNCGNYRQSTALHILAFSKRKAIHKASNSCATLLLCQEPNIRILWEWLGHTNIEPMSLAHPCLTPKTAWVGSDSAESLKLGPVEPRRSTGHC